MLFRSAMKLLFYLVIQYVCVCMQKKAHPDKVTCEEEDVIKDNVVKKNVKAIVAEVEKTEGRGQIKVGDSPLLPCCSYSADGNFFCLISLPYFIIFII